MLEVRHPEDRHAEQLEPRILIGDGLRLLIMDHGRGADTPQGRHAVLGLTGREAAVLEHGGVATAALGLLGGDARVVGGDDAQRLHEAVAEVVGQGVAVGAHDVAVRLLEDDVADGGERVHGAVVDDLIRGQDVVVVVDLDVAARDHAAAAVVIDQLVALQVERL